MSAAQKVLDRVESPKQSGAGRWMCKCPAHEDRGPSLSIRETEDGRVLIHSFALLLAYSETNRKAGFGQKRSSSSVRYPASTRATYASMVRFHAGRARHRSR
jgi:hypothetical protein